MINALAQMEVGRSRALGSTFSSCENWKSEGVEKGVGGGGYFLLAGDGHTDGCWFRSPLRGLLFLILPFVIHHDPLC